MCEALKAKAPGIDYAAGAVLALKLVDAKRVPAVKLRRVRTRAGKVVVDERARSEIARAA